MMKRLLLQAALLVTIMPVAAAAQWLNYPTPGLPRTADGKPNLSAPTPRTADGKPDLSGMWGWDAFAKCGAHCNDTQIAFYFLNIAFGLKGGPPYKPGVADLVKHRTGAQDEDPNVHCMPRGAPRIWTDDYYKRIFQVPGRLIILTERNMQYRQIFTDGRPLPEDQNPTWNGYSTAKWDGDALVVRSNGFRDGLWLDSNGSPLTEAATITERFRRPNYGTLEIALRVDDPKAYTRPWEITLKQVIVLDSELLDYVCYENEKSVQHFKK